MNTGRREGGENAEGGKQNMVVSLCMGVGCKQLNDVGSEVSCAT